MILKDKQVSKVLKTEMSLGEALMDWRPRGRNEQGLVVFHLTRSPVRPHLTNWWRHNGKLDERGARTKGIFSRARCVLVGNDLSWGSNGRVAGKLLEWNVAKITLRSKNSVLLADRARNRESARSYAQARLLSGLRVRHWNFRGSLTRH